MVIVYGLRFVWSQICMDMHIMHLCVYVLGTSLVLDLRYYKPINLLIFQPAPSLLLCAVSPGFLNLKEIK